MKSICWIVFATALVLAVLGGCGGGGTSPDGTDGLVGTLQGQVDLDGNDPANYGVFVDGQNTGVQIQPDGRFEVAGVPGGEHVIDVIRHSGMEAGRATVVVTPGRIVPVPGLIRLEGAGQIVGFVVKRINDQEQPLAGVEVVARSDRPWILTDDTTGPGSGETEPGTLIYPPPPGVEYAAFTQEDGSYCMKGVEPGPYFVVVAVPGLTSGQAYVWMEANRTAVADFVLRPIVEPGVGTVTGTVSGRSEEGTVLLVGAHVAMVFPGDWRPIPPDEPLPIIGVDQPASPPISNEAPGPPDVVWRKFRTLTDSQGRYSLNAPSGHAEMHVWAHGYEPESRPLTVQPDQTQTENFVLEMLSSISPGPVPDRPL